MSFPGYLVDSEGHEYYEYIDNVRGTRAGTIYVRSWWFVGELGWVEYVGKYVLGADVIAPGESYDWIFIFQIPKERNPSEFLFKYRVGETADLSVGKLKQGLSSISVAEKGG